MFSSDNPLTTKLFALILWEIGLDQVAGNHQFRKQGKLKHIQNWQQTNENQSAHTENCLEGTEAKPSDLESRLIPLFLAKKIFSFLL